MDLVSVVQQKRKAAGKAGKGKGGARVPENIDNLMCELCSAGHHEDKIILCDRCDKGFHLFCLSPPLDDVPAGDWICPVCVSADSEDQMFFREGLTMSMKEMREFNQSFQRSWWGDAKAKVRDGFSALGGVYECPRPTGPTSIHACSLERPS